MTYLANNDILAADINGLRGTTLGDASPQNTAGSIYGVGFGDRGYGQTAVVANLRSPGDDILSTNWTVFRTMLVTCASHQGTSQTLIPAANVLDPGDDIFAENNPPRAGDFPDMVTAVVTNRLNTNGGLSLTFTPSVNTVTRGSSWGAGNTSIQCEVDVDFTSEDQARYFFNSGGSVTLNLSHPFSLTQRNDYWNDLLNDIGQISFAVHGTTHTGSKGTSVALGYFELTTSYQTIFSSINQGAGGGYYYYYGGSTNDVVVEARATSITGLRGAKGSVVRFRVTLTDEDTTGVDLVSSGTALVTGHRRATAVLTGIVIPVHTTVTPF